MSDCYPFLYPTLSTSMPGALSIESPFVPATLIFWSFYTCYCFDSFSCQKNCFKRTYPRLTRLINVQQVDKCRVLIRLISSLEHNEKLFVHFFSPSVKMAVVKPQSSEVRIQLVSAVAGAGYIVSAAGSGLPTNLWVRCLVTKILGTHINPRQQPVVD
jgi:hypothetical protein